MIKTQNQIFNELCQIPPLKKGWVRLVHRCIDKENTVPSITKYGLVFNKNAAKLPLIRGGSYDSITQMASVYDETRFWSSLRHDDFAIYDNAQYADTKLVFDIPLEEYCFLKSFGRRIKGKIDSKYLVASISNINSSNPKLVLPVDQVSQAQKISNNNSEPKIVPNNIEAMIAELLEQCPSERRDNVEKLIRTAMHRNKVELRSAMQEKHQNKSINHLYHIKHTWLIK